MLLRNTTFWSTGFRPFFLLAAAMAVLWFALWALWLLGVVPLPAMRPFIWHGHEMIFGYTAAVIAGFLLTAASVWTRQSTASGVTLFVLVAFWLAGRAVMVLQFRFSPTVVACVDLAFLPLLALACGRPILATRNWRNAGFVPLLLLMAVANLVVHLERHGFLIGYSNKALQVSLDAVLLMVAIVGGRIIPLFTGNALPDVRVRERNMLDSRSLLGLLALLVVDALPVSAGLVAAIAVVAGGLNLARMVGWGSLSSSRNPLLAVLHLGYAWLPVGLFLRGARHWLPAIPVAAGRHALTVGSVGTLTLGMMTRVALGHTGRPLRAHAMTVVSYWLLTVSAIVRVVSPFFPQLYHGGLVAASVLWSLAFCCYLAIYTPILLAPRPDGKPG